MLEDLGKDLAIIAMAGVGAVAILTEKAVEVGKVCAEKGAETLEKARPPAKSCAARRAGSGGAPREGPPGVSGESGRHRPRGAAPRLAELDAKEAAEKAAAEAAAAEAAESTVEDNVIDFGGERKDDGQGE